MGQVGPFQATGLGENVGTGSLEIKAQPIKGHIVWVSRSFTNGLSDWLASVNAVHQLTPLIGATR